MYALFIKRSAERDLRRLPRALFERVNERILTLRDDPRPPGARKLAGTLEGWRVRVGDYRILYQIDDDAQTVTIVRVKHRREVYR
jgi:mRNA interferase RelE/StbE